MNPALPGTANASNLMMTPEPKKITAINQTQQKHDVPFETMLPAANEELKSMEIKSVGQSLQSSLIKPKKTSVSKSRRSVPGVDANINEDLKSKVSRMMSNHSQLVEDLKAKSSKARQSNKRASYAPSNPLQAKDTLQASLDKASADLIAREIDIYGRTLEEESKAGGVGRKLAAAGAKAKRQGSRKASESRRGTSPLRAGASLQLSMDP